MQNLIVGTIVQYVIRPGEVRAAIMSDVLDADQGIVHLHVMLLPRDHEPWTHLSNLPTLLSLAHVPYDAEGMPLTWHYFPGQGEPTKPKKEK